MMRAGGSSKTKAMMKKILILTVLAAAFAACGDEAVERNVDPAEAGTIGFAARSGAFTRAAEINAPADMAAAGFGVFAYSYAKTSDWNTPVDKALLFINQRVTGASGPNGGADGLEWSYGEPIRWPAGKKVSFFAYAPYDSGAAIGDDNGDGVPEISYGVTRQVDLLVAAEQTDIEPRPEPVTENFRHALSQIVLKARKTDEGAANEVILTGVSFRNIIGTGTVALQYPITWTPDSPLPLYSPGVITGTPLGTTAQDVLDGDPRRFVIPQSLSGTTLAVTFTVDGFPKSWEGPVPTPGGWQPGIRYTYTLNITGDLVAIVCGDNELDPLDPNGNWGEF